MLLRPCVHTNLAFAAHVSHCTLFNLTFRKASKAAVSLHQPLWLQECASAGLHALPWLLQVDYTEEAGSLFHFKYPVADSDDFLPVATTRPETIMGDSAVAVHPEDERYKHLVGRECQVPLSDRCQHLPAVFHSAISLLLPGMSWAGCWWRPSERQVQAASCCLPPSGSAHPLPCSRSP